MTKESAQLLLMTWLDSVDCNIPVDDCKVVEECDENDNLIQEYTFKGLLKIAYDLKDDPKINVNLN